jgi:DNA-binding XRE family transcriptional regulator
MLMAGRSEGQFQKDAFERGPGKAGRDQIRKAVRRNAFPLLEAVTPYRRCEGTRENASGFSDMQQPKQSAPKKKAAAPKTRPVAKGASAPDAALQKTVADNVRQARLALGISQRALARACDISQRHLSQIELQGSNIRLMTLVNLAQHLNTTPARLLTPSGN